MELPVIHVFTHDSIGLGEDGPTHQPVEHLASLRAIPGLNVIRPCDANEVAEAWRVAIEPHHQPVALVLTRQNVPILDRSRYASAEGLRRGGYVLADPTDGDPELILIATGSEVALAVEAYEELSGRRRPGRASSACRPASSSTTRTEEYRESVLPPAVTARVSIEEASTLGWDRYVGPRGRDDRHAHLRLLGAAQGRARTSSDSRRRRSSRPPRACSRRERRAESMKPTTAAARARPEPVGRQHHPDDARRRHARRLHRRALGHRPDLEPDDLRQGDRRRRRLRRADRRARASRGSRARTSSSSWRSPT